MAQELHDPRVMDPQTRRILLGTYPLWRVVAPSALIFASGFYLFALLTDTTVVQVVPTNVFEWVVLVSGVLLSGFVGYHRDGVTLALFVVGGIWFGSTYYGAMKPTWDTPAPGLTLAVSVAVVTAVGYGLPSYVSGRILRIAVEFFRGM